MASCKEKPQLSFSFTSAPAILRPPQATSTSVRVAAPKSVNQDLDKLVQKQQNNAKSEIPKKRETQLQTRELTVSDRAVATGKRLIVVENSSFGPSAEERGGPGTALSPDGTEIKDNFRYRSGRYWTTDKTGKELIFLSGQVRGEPWSVVDFNYTNTGILKPIDMDDKTSLFSERTPGTLDKLTKNIQNEQLPATASAFGTQQWILIQANSPYYTAPVGGLTLDQVHRYGPSFGSLSFSNASPSLYQSGFYAADKLKFNRSFWIADLRGGTVTENTSSVESEVFAQENDLSTNPPFVFTPTIAQGEDFFDHSFELPTPFSNKELESFSTINKPLCANIEPNYNFLIEKYENVLGSDVIPEQILPNLYVMVSELIQETNNEKFRNHITLGGCIELKEAPTPKASKRSDLENSDVKKINGQYFDKLSRKFESIQQSLPQELRVSRNAMGAFRDLQRSEIEAQFSSLMNVSAIKQRQIIDTRQIISTLEKNFTNIVLPMDNINLLKDFNDKKRMFPMYVDLEFSTDATTVIAQILKDSFLSTALQKRVVNGVISNVGVATRSFVDVTELLQLEKTQINGFDVNQINKEYSFNVVQHRTWDITGWLDDFEKVDDPNPEIRADARRLTRVEDESIMIGQSTVDNDASTASNKQFLRSLMKMIFVGKLRKLVKQKMRTYEEVMSGKLAYSETVLYRVQKSIANPDGTAGQFVQNFFFPNSNDIEILNFVDTQVKYNKEYVYEVFAYQAVIGTKYNYSNLTIKGDLAAFLVNQFPSIKLVEVSYFQSRVTVLDSPPVFPEIEAVPYRAISDKILFLLRSNVGDYIMQPVMIEPEDEMVFNIQRRARDLDIDDPIRFKTDDHSGFFQVFRTENKPTSYQDFEGKLWDTIETDVSKLTPKSATSAAFVDNIEPNKKYYYMFRIVDVHGHISNPSQVFEIEMVDERGAIFPLIEIVDFTSETPKMCARPFKKFIQITPALPHTLINEEKSKIQDIDTARDVKNVFLGIKDETVWGKKFKIRLTSKKTGKKIDFNIDFQSKDVRRVDPDEV